MAQSLYEYGQVAYTGAKEKGFYEPFPEPSQQLALRIMQSIALQCDMLDAHRKERDITTLHTLEHPPEWKDLVPDEQRAIMALLLLVSEVVECSDAVLEASEEHEAEELADIFIRLVDYAAWRGIDLADAVDAKMAVNKTRPYKHGKKF